MPISKANRVSDSYVRVRLIASYTIPEILREASLAGRRSEISKDSHEKVYASVNRNNSYNGFPFVSKATCERYLRDYVNTLVEKYESLPPHKKLVRRIKFLLRIW